MKKLSKLIVFCIAIAFLTSSCYSHTFAIGQGAQTGVEVVKKNHFFLFGLIPGNVSSPQEMAGETSDYEVTEVQTFVDGLVGTITFGIYTPTTTRVQK